MKFYGQLLLTLLIVLSCAELKSQKDYNFSTSLDSIKEENENKDDQAPAQTFFVDKAKEYGLEDIKAYNLNVVDLNGDDYSDIVVIPSFFSEPEFYYFDIKQRKFIKGESPFPEALKVSYLLFYDLNNDKVLDAITGVLNQKTEVSREPFRIYHGKKDQNNKLTFIEQKTDIKASPNSSVGLIDYNLDGKLEFYLANWFKRYKGNPIPHRDLLISKTKKGYEDISKFLVGELKQNPDQAMYINATPTYGVQVCDMDQNGYPDILTTSTNSYPNKLWMNRYKFREQYRYFEDVGVISGYASDTEGLLNTQGGGRTFGVACADYNNDGIMDVFVGELTHNYDNEGVDKSSILTGRTLKSSPRFYRTEYTQDSFDPNWHQADRRGIWSDLNNDGLVDLIVDNSGYPPHTKLIVFEQHPDHSFTNRSREYGIDIMNPISTVLLDVNRDGKMDILTSQSSIRDDSIKPRIYLFENNLDIKGNKSIRFYLRGKKANYHGLNATVVFKIKRGNEYIYQTQNVSYSYGALPPQIEEGLHFGFTPEDKLINVTVRWPYAEKLNENRATIEKIYNLDKLTIDDFMYVTLCESGEYLIGRLECP